MRHVEGSSGLFGKLLAAIGITLVVGGLSVFVRHALTMHAYANLGQHQAQTPFNATEPETAGAAADNQIDWEGLLQQNRDVSAWLRVEGTSIDLPVMAAPAEDPVFYLAHDFWGNPSLEGAPYLDHRCDAHMPHRLVYGHHLTMGGQFSELQRAYLPERFTTLGRCHWTTPVAGESALVPLCSSTTHASDQRIQRFSFDDQVTLNRWLVAIASTSMARSKDWEYLAADAISAITLVTCTSDWSHEDTRTIVTFVEVARQRP